MFQSTKWQFSILTQQIMQFPKDQYCSRRAHGTCGGLCLTCHGTEPPVARSPSPHHLHQCPHSAPVLSFNNSLALKFQRTLKITWINPFPTLESSFRISKRFPLRSSYQKPRNYLDSSSLITPRQHIQPPKKIHHLFLPSYRYQFLQAAVSFPRQLAAQNWPPWPHSCMPTFLGPHSSQNAISIM